MLAFQNLLINLISKNSYNALLPSLEEFLSMQRKMQNGIELSPVVDRFILPF